MDDAEIERALVIAAHPDDADFGSAGTVAALDREGIEVAYCIVTSGDAGGFDPTVPRSEIPGIREAEQRAAAAEVGRSRRHLPRLSRRRRRGDPGAAPRHLAGDPPGRPQRVVCQSPERNWARIVASHPDHLRTGEAALCAVYPDARNPFAHPELLADGFAEWSVGEVWINAAPTALLNH